MGDHTCHTTRCAHRVVWQSFAKIGPGTSKIWWTEKKEKETRPKYSSLSLSLTRSRATVITGEVSRVLASH